MAGRPSRVARKPPTNASARATLIVAISAVSWGIGGPSNATLRIGPHIGVAPRRRAGRWARGWQASALYDDVLAAPSAQQQLWQLLELADLPGVEQQAGVEDRAIGAQSYADQDRQHEMLNGAAAEDVQRHEGQERGDRGVDRAAERLNQAVIHDVGERLAGVPDDVLADAVKDDDGVMD